MKKVFFILIVMISFVLIAACKNESVSHVPLDQLKKPDGSFCWGYLSWGMDIEQVEGSLGYALSENANVGLSVDDQTDYRKDDYTGTAVFMEKETSELFGVRGIIGYTFLAGSFKDVFITFYAEDNSQEHLREAYEQLQTTLISSYGEPDEIRDSDSFGFFSINPHWVGSEVNGKNTGLNCSILYTDTDQTEIHSFSLAVSTYGGSD